LTRTTVPLMVTVRTSTLRSTSSPPQRKHITDPHTSRK